MTNVSSRDVFLAILAMDVYHQGYDRGINHDQTTIGSATFESDSASLGTIDNVRRDETAGFYAATYRIDGSRFDGLGANDIVISFRGTDNFVPLTSGSDVGSGWVTGAGILGNQPIADAPQICASMTNEGDDYDQVLAPTKNGRAPKYPPVKIPSVMKTRTQSSSSPYPPTRPA